MDNSENNLNNNLYNIDMDNLQYDNINYEYYKYLSVTDKRKLTMQRNKELKQLKHDPIKNKERIELLELVNINYEKGQKLEQKNKKVTTPISEPINEIMQVEEITEPVNEIMQVEETKEISEIIQPTEEPINKIMQILEINNNNDDALFVSAVDNSIIENPLCSTVENSTVETPFFHITTQKLKYR